MTTDPLPLVSVVIATKDRAQLLATTLAAIGGQRWPRECLEVLVADNGSSDGTRGVVAAAQRQLTGAAVRYLHVPEPGKSFAVNTALSVARGDILAMTDDDVQPEADWLASIARAFADAEVDFVAGRIFPLWQTRPPTWMSPALYGVLAVPDNGSERQPLSASGGVMPIGANMALRRRALERVGGLCVTLGKLDGSLRTGEDHEFFLRLLEAGCRGIYEPTAVVRHLVPTSRMRTGYFRSWFYQNGRDVARLQRVYPPPSRRLVGVPRYLWREAAIDAWTWLKAVAAGDSRQRVASAGRLVWFVGYLRELLRSRGAEPPPAGTPLAGSLGTS